MTRIFLTLSLLALNTVVFAHEGTDWKTDRNAFLRAKPEGVRVVPQTIPKHFDQASLQIDPAFLKEKLTQLVEYAGERMSARGRDLARQFLEREYRELGMNTNLHHYSYTPLLGTLQQGANFVAELPGQDPSKVIVLSSHFDSVGNKGANDDGTGTIVALAIAKELSKKSHQFTLRVVAFDEEENGMIGSESYVKDLGAQSPQIVGAVQMEMMGTNSRGDGAFHVIDCDRPDSKFLTDKIMSAVTTLNLPLSRVKTCTYRSDHASFWEANIPAVVLSENFFGGDGDRCYHRACDVVDERLNFNYMANIGQAVGVAVEAMLEGR